MLLSVVIPTYKEKENLQELLPLVSDELTKAKIPFEILIVDDNSNDGTEELVKSLKMRTINLIVRKDKRGLSSAVYDGILQSKGEVVCFMDADFSHPPQALPGMYRLIENNEAELVVGSRLVKGGGVDKWPWYRKFTSFVARCLAIPLTPVHDITSGFFMFKKSVFPQEKLNLSGFKIGLEIAAKGNYKKVKEYPIIFSDRKYGESKLSGRIIFDYLKQLAQLYVYKIKFYKK
ncbi:MAG: polyprenol monophosphomannose synthase [Candidatus Margulisbacteria bacterium]|nr:polyprenol monophosphomannose synthase [Candidatus Margulisiibacteriota bacterium]